MVRGRVWTGEKTLPFAEAFLVRNGVFAAVGDFSEIRELAWPEPF